MDENSRRRQGHRTRSDVLGEDVAARSAATVTDLNADFRDLITRTAFGEVWSRPGLERRLRSVAMLGALTALSQETEFAVHVRAAVRNGLSQDEIAEVLLHLAVYCGLPAAERAFAVAERALDV
jgi:alkylhydroperoxidase/carboxymuconolactone decarboxylase family protein YurZ